MAHSGRGPINRHAKFVNSRGTHSEGGFDPTAGGDSRYGADMDVEQIGAWQIPPGSVNDGVIDPGGLDGDESLTPGSLELTPFADGVRPVAVLAGGSAGADANILLEDGDDLLAESNDFLVTEAYVAGDPGDLLPALPDTLYPPGCVVYNIDDGKLYRNVLDVWTRAVDGLDLIADSVLAGAIRAGVIETEHFAATATIALVANDGTTVVIDPDGLTIIEGAITVSNGDDVVIIDGTSDIFKIVTSGTVSHEQAAQSWGQTYAELSGTGLPVQTPAVLSWMAEGLTPGSSDERTTTAWHKRRLGSGSIGWVSSTTGGANNVYFWPALGYHYVTALVRNGNPTVSVIVENGRETGGAVMQAYARYHVLKEAAI